MEREYAVQILAAIQSLKPGFNEATRITLSMQDEEEARQPRRYLAQSMGEPLFQIVRHIVRQHPDLDPDKDDIGVGSSQ
jgi:hypothetical protein